MGLYHFADGGAMIETGKFATYGAGEFEELKCSVCGKIFCAPDYDSIGPKSSLKETD